MGDQTRAAFPVFKPHLVSPGFIDPVEMQGEFRRVGRMGEGVVKDQEHPVFDPEKIAEKPGAEVRRGPRGVRAPTRRDDGGPFGDDRGPGEGDAGRDG